MLSEEFLYRNMVRKKLSFHTHTHTPHAALIEPEIQMFSLVLFELGS